MPKLNPKEEAQRLWKLYNFYWVEPELIAKQKIVHQIGETVKALINHGITDLDYYHEVKKEVYEI